MKPKKISLFQMWKLRKEFPTSKTERKKIENKEVKDEEI